MNYIIKLNAISRIKNHGTLPYNELNDCFGSIVIKFSHNSKSIDYENNTVNVPLFLTEIDNFLHYVDCTFPKRWYLGFAPFAYGILHNGSLLISSRNGKEFAGSVYDTTAEDDLYRLRAQVTRDLSRYGKVQMDIGQAGKIVTDF